MTTSTLCPRNEQFSLPRLPRFIKHLFTLCAVFSGLTTVTSTLGQNRDWNGGGTDDNWTTSANWSAAPAAGMNPRFGGTTRLTPNNDFAAATGFGAITFLAGAGEFTLGGNSITLGGNITNSSANHQTIAMDLILSDNRSINPGSAGVTISGSISGAFNFSNSTNDTTLTLTGANTFSGTLSGGTASRVVILGNALAAQNASLAGAGEALQFAEGIGSFTAGGIAYGSGTGIWTDLDDEGVEITITGGGSYSTGRPISGKGSLVVDLDTGGMQTFTSAASSWEGGTTINSGTVRLQQNFGLPSGGDLHMTGGTLEYHRITNNVVTLNFSIGTLSGTDGLITSSIADGGSIGTLNMLVNQATDEEFEGDITHEVATTSTFQKNGAGELILSGTNSWNGTTLVNAGSLIINGDSSGATGNWTVQSGATLGGSGTIGGNTTINNGGTLAPGNSTGVLSFDNNLSFNAGSASLFEINGVTRGTDYDGVDIGGDLNYGGSLTINFGTTFGVGTYTFNLFDFDTAWTSTTFTTIDFTGNYTGSMSDEGLGNWEFLDGDNTFYFDSSTGNLSLTVIPEPSTAAFLLLAGLGLLAARRRCRGLV